MPSTSTESKRTSARAAGTSCACRATAISRRAPRARSSTSAPRRGRRTWSWPPLPRTASPSIHLEVGDETRRHNASRKGERESRSERAARQLRRREARQRPLLLHADRLPRGAADLDLRLGLLEPRAELPPRD